MDKTYRKTIAELVALYTFEPQLRDLYVEGINDKTLLEWFFKQFDIESINVIEINSISVDDSLITRLGLKHGNRDRVVALSLEFERLLQNKTRYLVCLADSDFDFILGRKYKSPYLLYTDYTSIDLYFISKNILEKLLSLGLGKPPSDVNKLLMCLAQVLQEVFLIRAINESLNWNISFTPFTKCCEIKGSYVIFHYQKFIEKSLLKNARFSDVKTFNDTYEQLKKKKTKTFRHTIRALDYFELLGWYISKQIGTRGNKYKDPEVIRAIIYTAADVKSLTKEKLFKALLKRYNR
jgi:hypothetical protein